MPIVEDDVLEESEVEPGVDEAVAGAVSGIVLFCKIQIKSNRDYWETVWNGIWKKRKQNEAEKNQKIDCKISQAEKKENAL